MSPIECEFEFGKGFKRDAETKLDDQNLNRGIVNQMYQ